MGTLTVKMDQMRSVILGVNLVVKKPCRTMSKPGQQDMGKSKII